MQPRIDFTRRYNKSVDQTDTINYFRVTTVSQNALAHNNTSENNDSRGSCNSV